MQQLSPSHSRASDFPCLAPPLLPGNARYMPPSAAPAPGAGEGNRTLVISLEGFCSTIELHPRKSWCRPCSQATGGSNGAGGRLHRRPTYPSDPAQSPNLMINRSKLKFWWRGLDSNQRTQRGQIYSLLPLTTRPPLPRKPQIIADFGGSRQTNQGFPSDSATPGPSRRGWEGIPRSLQGRRPAMYDSICGAVVRVAPAPMAPWIRDAPRSPKR